MFELIKVPESANEDSGFKFNVLFHSKDYPNVNEFIQHVLGNKGDYGYIYITTNIDIKWPWSRLNSRNAIEYGFGKIKGNDDIFEFFKDYRIEFASCQGYYHRYDFLIRVNPKKKITDVCDLCCTWYEDHKFLSPKDIVQDYPSLMEYILIKKFNFSKEAASKFINDACMGNWDRLHETTIEKTISAETYADQLIGDIHYCSDRWTWDRVIRVQWLYKRLKNRVYAMYG